VTFGHHESRPVFVAQASTSGHDHASTRLVNDRLRKSAWRRHQSWTSGAASQSRARRLPPARAPASPDGLAAVAGRRARRPPVCMHPATVWGDDWWRVGADRVTFALTSREAARTMASEFLGFEPRREEYPRPGGGFFAFRSQ
jgi:hypothetical protein